MANVVNNPAGEDAGSDVVGTEADQLRDLLGLARALGFFDHKASCPVDRKRAEGKPSVSCSRCSLLDDIEEALR